MGIIENFKKLGYRFISSQHKTSMTKRQALKEIHAMLCNADTDEPLAVQQKFEKINVNEYTDEQVTRILKSIKATSHEFEKSKTKV
jgi:hypothetical protein